MYDAGKIVAGLAIFLIMVTFPIWYVTATGQSSYVPQLEIDPGEEQCIEATDYMKKNHMILLDDWKTMVVREGISTYVASDGKTYNISLSGTCLSSCHPNKLEFCDSCHTYVGTSPPCWSCHTWSIDESQ